MLHHTTTATLRWWRHQDRGPRSSRWASECFTNSRMYTTGWPPKRLPQRAAASSDRHPHRQLAGSAAVRPADLGCARCHSGRSLRPRRSSEDREVVSRLGHRSRHCGWWCRPWRRRGAAAGAISRTRRQRTASAEACEKTSLRQSSTGRVSLSSPREHQKDALTVAQGWVKAYASRRPWSSSTHWRRSGRLAATMPMKTTTRSAASSKHWRPRRSSGRGSPFPQELVGGLP